jgi:hypothetical protein
LRRRSVLCCRCAREEKCEVSTKIADNLKKRGWSLGYVSAIDTQGRTIWIVDAHRDGKRFIVRADEKLTAFVELESAALGLRSEPFNGGLALRLKE